MGLVGGGGMGYSGDKGKRETLLTDSKRFVFHRCEMKIRSHFRAPVGADGAFRRGWGVCICFGTGFTGWMGFGTRVRQIGRRVA